MEIIKTESLTFTYPQKEIPALTELDLSILQGSFVTVCGQSGCGKTTLLRHFKSALTPPGTRTGSIRLADKEISEVDIKTQMTLVGYVLQNPESQISTENVKSELTFGLEGLGVDEKTIRLRVAEMASFFGIHTWFAKNITELSGGQKQLLNLASIMAMQPSILILDEPTSQLDPIAASDFLNTIKKINQELGTTIIMTEHRLEDVLPMSDRVIVIDSGRIIADGAPRDIGRQLKSMGHGMFASMPAPMQVYAGVKSDLECPVTVRDGRMWINRLLNGKRPSAAAGHTQNRTSAAAKKSPVIELKDVWFKYGKNAPDVVCDLSLKIYEGELYCILGGNGTGKTTTLSLIGGTNRAYRGKVIVGGRQMSKIPAGELCDNNLVILPQNPGLMFVKDTVREDLLGMLPVDLSRNDRQKKLDHVSELVEIRHLLDQHPGDLSGGERQRAGLAKILLRESRIILLDEPTKGLDGEFKQKLAAILGGLKKSGATIVMVCHDVEFAAKYADRCAMFFNGNVVAEGAPRDFFPGNRFYTTAANRMVRHVFPSAVSADDVIALCNYEIARNNPNGISAPS